MSRQANALVSPSIVRSPRSKVGGEVGQLKGFAEESFFEIEDDLQSEICVGI